MKIGMITNDRVRMIIKQYQQAGGEDRDVLASFPLRPTNLQVRRACEGASKKFETIVINIDQLWAFVREACHPGVQYNHLL